MASLTWRDLTAAEGCRYHRRGSIPIEQGTGHIQVDICVPAEVQSDGLIVVSIERVRGQTRIQQKWKTDDPCSIEVLPRTLAMLRDLGHPWPDGHAERIHVLFRRDAKLLQDALRQVSRDRQLSEQRVRSSLSRTGRPGLPSFREAGNAAASLGKPGPISRRGRGGIKTSYVAKKRRPR
jgi:hypothetical protein